MAQVVHAAPRKRIFIPALWMFGLAVLLFWIPVVGPFMAGVVGGKKAGGIGHAIAASILPSIVIGLASLFGFTLVWAPIIGLITGLGLGVLLVLDDFAMIAGALVGGALA